MMSEKIVGAKNCTYNAIFGAQMIQNRTTNETLEVELD